jgi:hypothetical protein
MGENKARGANNSAFNSQMMSLLGQRGQLENQRDKVVADGETQRDQFDAQDQDNYYTNMAANLTNFGTNIQGLGRNLNKRQENTDNADLIGLMSKNGIRIGRKKGRLKIVNN